LMLRGRLSAWRRHGAEARTLFGESLLEMGRQRADDVNGVENPRHVIGARNSGKDCRRPRGFAQIRGMSGRLEIHTFPIGLVANTVDRR